MPWIRIPERSDEQIVMGLAIGVPLLAVGTWALATAAGSTILVGIGLAIVLAGMWMVAVALLAATSSRANHGRSRRPRRGRRR
jgi:hypothetical protein